MDHAKAIEAVESRAFAARKTVAAVCDKAGVYHSTWSRAKTRGVISVDVLLRMERALEAFEGEAK